MSYSKLTNKYIPASTTNYSKGRAGQKIRKITPHHMAGNLTIEQCGAVFQKANRNASANYGIGTDGRIACYVDEENKAWTSSSPGNDNQAITVEIANNGDAKSGWPISDKALDAYMNLCVDICKRHGITKLVYDGTPNGNHTRHNMFASTTCPGPYFQGRMKELTDRINERLTESPKPNPQPKPQPAGFKVGDYVVPIKNVDYKGVPLVQYDKKYQILEIDSRGAVLGAVRGNARPVWAVLSLNNIKKV